MDWSKADTSLAKEIQRQGEALLVAQQAFAIAADQRAVRLIGTLATLSMALVGLGLTALAGDQPRTILGLASLAAGISAIVGLLCALPAGRPGTFNANGAPPSVWEADLASGADFSGVLPEYCDHLQTRIDENEAILRKNARAMNQAINCTTAAPLVGLLVAALAWVARAEGWLA